MVMTDKLEEKYVTYQCTIFCELRYFSNAIQQPEITVIPQVRAQEIIVNKFILVVINKKVNNCIKEE